MVVNELLTVLGFKVDSSNAEKFNKVLKTTKKVMLGVVAVSGAVGYSVLKTAGEVEQMTIAFDSMLGSVEKSKAFMKDLFEFAKNTPFEVEELIGYSKAMIATGFTTDEIITKMKYLGNIASGVGKEKLPTILIAFNKIKSKGKATLEELNMLTEAGIPILKELSKNYGVTTEEMFEMISAGKLGFKDVDDALKSMGSGSGMFAGLMTAQMKSFFGVISNIKDAIFQLKLAIGNQLLPEALALSKAFLEFIEVNKEMIALKTVAFLKKVAFGLGFVYGVFKTIFPYLVKWAGLGADALGKMLPIIKKIAMGIKDFFSQDNSELFPNKDDGVSVFGLDWDKIGKSMKDEFFKLLDDLIWMVSGWGIGLGEVIGTAFKDIGKILLALLTQLNYDIYVIFFKPFVDMFNNIVNMIKNLGTIGVAFDDDDGFLKNLQQASGIVADSVKGLIFGTPLEPEIVPSNGTRKPGAYDPNNPSSLYNPNSAPSVVNTTNAPVANVTVNVPEGASGTPEDIAKYVSEGVKREMDSMLRNGNANSGVVE